MNSIICPVSKEKVNNNVVRITGFLMALMIGMYFLTSNILFIAIIAVDYLIRSMPDSKYSLFSWISHLIVQSLRLRDKKIGKGQKIFAARIGLLFINPVASMIVAGILMFFALLESLFNICAGCMVYTYLVYPFFEKGKYEG